MAIGVFAFFCFILCFLFFLLFIVIILKSFLLSRGLIILSVLLFLLPVPIWKLYLLFFILSVSTFTFLICRLSLRQYGLNQNVYFLQNNKMIIEPFNSDHIPISCLLSNFSTILLINSPIFIIISVIIIYN